jgi:hypothetical protein
MELVSCVIYYITLVYLCISYLIPSFLILSILMEEISSVKISFKPTTICIFHTEFLALWLGTCVILVFLHFSYIQRVFNALNKRLNNLNKSENIFSFGGAIYSYIIVWGFFHFLYLIEVYVTLFQNLTASVV